MEPHALAVLWDLLLEESKNPRTTTDSLSSIPSRTSLLRILRDGGPNTVSRLRRGSASDEVSSPADIDRILDRYNGEGNDNSEDDSDKEDPLKDVLWPVSPAEIYTFYTTFQLLAKNKNECGASRIEHFLYGHTRFAEELEASSAKEGDPRFRHAEKELRRVFMEVQMGNVKLAPRIIPLFSHVKKEIRRVFLETLMRNMKSDPSSIMECTYQLRHVEDELLRVFRVARTEIKFPSPLFSLSEGIMFPSHLFCHAENIMPPSHPFYLATNTKLSCFRISLEENIQLEVSSIMECIPYPLFSLAEKELRRVIMEALKENFNEPEERYIKNSAGVSDCTHGPECFCYFVSSKGAGAGNIRFRASDVLKRVQQVLINAIRISTKFLQCPLSRDAREMLRIILSDDPFDLEAQSSPCKEEGTRSQWLGWESEFRSIGKPRKITLQPGIPLPPNMDTPLRAGTAFLLRLIELLGRRVLVISAVLKGIGAQFIKREPLTYLHLGRLLGGRASPTKQRAAATEAPSYPIRVINVKTLQFEEDQGLFWNSYAVLSHSWGKLEVTFASVKEVFYCMNQRMKENITQQLDELQKSDSQDEKKILVLQECQKQIEKLLADSGQPESSQKSKVNDAKFVGQRKLMGAIRKTKEAGFDYLWVDSCCINKSDNTELVESLSCMGKWYQNASVCLVYLSDFSQEEVPSKLHPKLRPRWSTRGWTLQEIVMSRRAIYYNKFWKEIADTKSLDCSTEDANYSGKEDRSEEDDDSEADWGENDEDNDNYVTAKWEWGIGRDEASEDRGSEDMTEELGKERKPWEALAYLSNVRPSNLLCCGKKPDVPASLILRLASERETGYVFSPLVLFDNYSDLPVEGPRIGPTP